MLLLAIPWRNMPEAQHFGETIQNIVINIGGLIP
jgi:hypothetical protein